MSYVYNLENARKSILAHYGETLALYQSALKSRDWKALDVLSGQLRGLAYALGAVGYKEDLPQ